MAKSRESARSVLSTYRVPLDRNFFSFSSSEVEDIVKAAKAYGYRKSKNAPGSTARMFYRYACG